MVTTQLGPFSSNDGSKGPSITVPSSAGDVRVQANGGKRGFSPETRLKDSTSTIDATIIYHRRQRRITSNLRASAPLRRVCDA